MKKLIKTINGLIGYYDKVIGYNAVWAIRSV
jgi:hypothetical protein